MLTWARRYIGQHPLISFVIINYAISWALLYPAFRILLAAKGSFPLKALFGLIGGYGPSLAAVIVLAVTLGKGGVGSALRKFLIWRVSPRWYLYVLVLPVCAYALAVLIHVRPPVDLLAGLRGVPFAWLIALPFGPLGEELGWRGFLLPRLLERFEATTATLIVGLVWTVWHVAAFTFPGAAIPSVLPVNALTVCLYAVQITAEACIFTYVYFQTRGSLVIAVMLHMAFNASGNIVEGFLPSIGDANDLKRQAYFTSLMILVVWAVATMFFDRTLRSRTFLRQPVDTALKAGDR